MTCIHEERWFESTAKSNNNTSQCHMTHCPLHAFHFWQVVYHCKAQKLNFRSDTVKYSNNFYTDKNMELECLIPREFLWKFNLLGINSRQELKHCNLFWDIRWEWTTTLEFKRYRWNFHLLIWLFWNHNANRTKLSLVHRICSWCNMRRSSIITDNYYENNCHIAFSKSNRSRNVGLNKTLIA